MSERYFETLGTALVAGRDFSGHDTSASLAVAIISQAMAEKYFGATNPLGRYFRIRNGTLLGRPVQIVGIVRDVKYGSLRDDPSPYAFIPWSQGGVPGPLTSFELRAAGGSPTALIPGAKSAIAGVNPDVSIEFQTLAAKVDHSMERETLLATLSGFFGGLALMLAAMGLYGVVAYNVARRRNEIGIRMALGAEQSRVLRMVLAEVGGLVGIGLAGGLGMTLFTTRFVASFLYGVKPNDPQTLDVAAVVLAGAALAAGYLPARRASKLDPMTALREE